MDKEEYEQAAFIEALIIQPERESGRRPLYYCRGELHNDWWGHGKEWDIKYYNKDNKLHRIYGPAYISKKYDIEGWYKDGVLHRENGPAYRHKGNSFWYKEGKLHRLDGPAVVAGGHPKEYWINGQKLRPKYYKIEIARMKRKGLIK